MRTDRITIDDRPYPRRVHIEPAALESLRASIEALGRIDNPLTVRPHPIRAGYFQLVGGERRYEAVSVLGWAEVPVEVVQLSDAEALQTSIQEDAEQAGERTNLEQAWRTALLRSLRSLEGESTSQRVLGKEIGKSKNVVGYQLAIADGITRERVERVSHELGIAVEKIATLAVRVLRMIASAPDHHRDRLLRIAVDAGEKDGHGASTRAVRAAIDALAAGANEAEEGEPGPDAGSGDASESGGLADERQAKLNALAAALEDRLSDLRSDAQEDSNGSVAERDDSQARHVFPNQDSSQDRDESPGRDASQADRRETSLDERQAKLDEREMRLDERQTRLDERETRLDERQANLDERGTTLVELAAALESHRRDVRSTAEADSGGSVTEPDGSVGPTSVNGQQLAGGQQLTTGQRIRAFVAAMWRRCTAWIGRGIRRVRDLDGGASAES